MAHLYRGEVSRSDNWRSRLDSTTNWTLTTTGAVISVGLGSTQASHAVFLAGMILVLNFLVIEIGRYRNWDVYLRRVRVIETLYFVPMLRSEDLDRNRMRELANMLEAPRMIVPFTVAFSQRVRRAYGAIFGVLLCAWMVKLTVHHEQLTSLKVFVDRAHVGLVPGWLVFLAVCLLYTAIGVLTLRSIWARPVSTELRPPRRRGSLQEAFGNSWRLERVAENSKS